MQIRAIDSSRTRQHGDGTAFVSREIHLRRRPAELPTEDDFQIVERSLPSPAAGKLIVRNLWMSVDPYMRGRMREGRSYIAPFDLDAPLDGAAVGVVEASGASDFSEGDVVTHFSGWRDYALIDATTARRVDTSIAPAQTYLGPLGTTGFTAYVGLLKLGKPKAGETVLVSAGAGAVGSITCQLARLQGMRVVASAGSLEKVSWLREELGVDAAINYRTETDLIAAVARDCPSGVDVYFDNVGGDHLDAALRAANDFGRFVLCGMIGQYNQDQPPPGPRWLFLSIAKRLTLQGFIITDHQHLMPEFLQTMSGLLMQGRIKWRETVYEGLESAPGAFIALFRGENVGKALVALDE